MVTPSEDPEDQRTGELAEDPEIDRITVVRLGGSFPVDRGEGLIIPIWVLGHYDRDFHGKGFGVSAWIRTTRLEATVDKPFFGGLRLGVEARAEILSADNSPFRYEDGERIEERAFRTSTVGGGIFARYETPDGIRAALRYRLRRYYYVEGVDTDPAFVLPTDNTTHGIRADVGWKRVRTFQNREIQEGFAAGLFAEYERRDAWTSWGDEPETLLGFEERQDYFRYGGSLGGYLRFFRHHNLQVDFSARFGEDLDYLSAFAPGSQLGAERVAGYYFAEFRARGALVTNLRYGANLWEGGRGTLLFDGAAIQERDGWDWITGVGLAVRQTVWLGIPVVLQYAYGIDAVRKGARGGHEVVLTITAAF